MKANGEKRKMNKVRSAAALFLLVTAVCAQAAWSMAPQIAIPASSTIRPLGLRPGQTATLLPSGQWLLLGGEGRNGPVSTATIQDPSSGTTTTLKPGMLFARAWHSATLLPNGQILVIGGMASDGKFVPTSEIFDPNSQSAGVSIPDLLPRAHHSATLLTDGSVLVAGGIGNTGTSLATVELWDSLSRKTSVLPTQLDDRRQDHVATLLADGTVLLWGGTDTDKNPMSYADLYSPVTKTFTLTTFERSATTDMNLPYLEISLPADGDSQVPTDPVIGLRFSKVLQVQTVNLSSVILTGPAGEIAVSVVPAEDGRLAFISPLALLESGTTYLLTIEGSLDTQGLRLVHKTVSFTTVGTPADSSSATSTSSSSTSSTAAQLLPPLQAPPGVTALSGQALLVNGQPLPDVTISIGPLKTRTDRTGRFLLQRTGIGHQVFVIEGSTANYGTNTFGLFEVGTEIRAGVTNVLGYKIWMTPLDRAHTVSIPSPTITDTIVTTPALPGLKLDLPPQTVIYDHYGRVVHQLTITPIRLDRTPFPIPQGLDITFYFTIQPGGAYLRVGGDKYPRGARLIYPNVRNKLPGTRFSFWNYDPDQKGWFVYGAGSVSSDGKDVVPDPGVSIYEFTGAMDGGSGGGPPGGPPPGGKGKGGDPVDASTGLFVYEHGDFYLPDVIPINVTRTYRQGDTTSRAFGLGTTISYDIFPVGDQFPYTYMDLVMPDGGRVHYYRISSGTGFTDAVFMHTSTPTKFYGSTISWDPAINVNGGGWALRFKDGTIWGFPDSFQATTGAQGALLFIQDRYGNRLTISRDHGANNNSLGTGNISQITSPNGRWLQFTYDSCNRIQQITDNIGRSTHYQYDSSSCNSGHLQVATDQNSNTTTYAYQGATIDQMTSITDGRQIQYLQNIYDSNDRIHQQILANQGTYTFNYTTDGFGNITQTTITDPNSNTRQLNFSTPAIFQSGFQTGGYLTSQTYALGRPEQQVFTYNLGTPSSNPGNFLQSVTDPLSRTTSFTYDSLGNVTSTTRLTGTSSAATTSLTYEPTFSRATSITDPNGNTTTAAYNDSINQIIVTDPLGNQWTETQNSLGQGVSLKDPSSNTWQFGYIGADLTSVTDALSNTTSYEYDGAGRKLSMTDPLYETTTFAYSGLGQLLKITDPLSEVTQYGYDPNSNLTSVTDPKNTANPTQFFYDNMDHMYRRTDALGNSDNYSYDLNGNLTCHTDRKGQITVFGYDGLNRKTSAGFGAASCTSSTFQNSISYAYDGGNRLQTAVDSLTGTVNLNYDGLDDLNYENTPQGTINYTFDSVRRRTGMTITGQAQVIYGYDAANNLLSITQGSNTVGMSYDNVGRRSLLSLPNNVSLTYSYDPDSRMTGITYQNGATVLGNLAYTYDAAGRRSQVGGSYARSNIPATLSSAQYNAANQITSWAGTSVAYDLDGNLQSDGTNTYSWDLRNQLSAISGGSTASFQYDGIGRRTSKTISGASTAFLYDGANIAQELSGTTPTANITTGLGIDEIYSRTDSAGARYFLNDILGGVLALTNSSGAVATNYTYDPYGNTTTSGGSSTNSFQYENRENDGTGLYFYRARYHKTGFDRFVSEDPLGFAGGINLFAFEADNPINLIDPYGLKPPDCQQNCPPPPPPPPPCTQNCPPPPPPPAPCTQNCPPPPPPPPPCTQNCPPPPPPPCQWLAGQGEGWGAVAGIAAMTGNEPLAIAIGGFAAGFFLTHFLFCP
jgi:RHS repeat-associated protein